jgi:hypothetical protein
MTGGIDRFVKRLLADLPCGRAPQPIRRFPIEWFRYAVSLQPVR